MIAFLTQLELAFWVLGCAVFVLLAGLFSGMETGIYCASPLRLRLAAHENKRSARLRKLLDDQPGTPFTTLLGATATEYLASACLRFAFLGAAMQQMDEQSLSDSEQQATLLTTPILTPTVFIFSEPLPKNVFQRQTDR
jgi:CBS domain containing-hemolysin-like protein